MGLFGFLKPAPLQRPARRPSEVPALPARDRIAQAHARETGDWSRVRSPERDRDIALTDLARRWIDGLPAAVRPHALAERYPRIANRLALCWGDPVLVGPMLDDLLVDKRGNRQGFPAPVAADLRQLQTYFATKHEIAAAAAEPWSPNAMAVVDR